MPLQLEIVTPEKKVYDESVDYVTLSTVQGEIGILPGHIPLLASLQPGEIQLTSGGKTENLAIDKGFAQILGDKVSVLTEGAINVEQIDLSAIKDARLRAEQALADAEKIGMDPAEVERLEAIVRFSIAQRLAKQRRL